MMQVNWKSLTTQGRIDSIRAVWFPGCSTAQIAANFREATRNAIIGVYHRYGQTNLFDKPLNARSPINIAGTKAKQRRVGNIRPRVELSTVRPPKPLPAPPEATGEAQLCGKPLLMLQAKECRWSVNDAVGDALHLFCGRPTERTYCAHHHLRAYRGATQ